MEVDVKSKNASSAREVHRSRNTFGAAAVLLLVLLVIALSLAACGSSSPSSSTVSSSTGVTGAPSSLTAAASQGSTSTTITPPVVDADLAADLNSPAQAVLNTVYPSVVNIRVEATVQGQNTGGVGSGIIYTADGLILTNAHVVTLDGSVTSGQTITVTLSDGNTAPATVVGVDDAADVAAVQIQKTGLQPVTFGATKDVHLGEWAVVIGSPLDFRNSVTLGIVSGLDRTLDTGTGTPITGLMQIDTPISPGNSGGGCFDTAGRFIGMPEVYLPPAQTGAENIGFCIPADAVAAAAKSLTGK
jgi:S1-C subfamily serine protease